MIPPCSFSNTLRVDLNGSPATLGTGSAEREAGRTRWRNPAAPAPVYLDAMAVSDYRYRSKYWNELTMIVPYDLHRTNRLTFLLGDVQRLSFRRFPREPVSIKYSDKIHNNMTRHWLGWHDASSVSHGYRVTAKEINLTRDKPRMIMMSILNVGRWLMEWSRELNLVYLDHQVLYLHLPNNSTAFRNQRRGPF